MTNDSGFAVVAMSKSNSIKERLMDVVEQHGSRSDGETVEQKSDWREDAKGRDFAGSHTIDLSHLDDETSTPESTDDTVDAANLRAALTSAQRRQESIPRTGNPIVGNVEEKATSDAIEHKADLLTGAAKSLETVGNAMSEMDAALQALQQTDLSDDEIKSQVRERVDLGGSQ